MEYGDLLSQIVICIKDVHLGSQIHDIGTYHDCYRTFIQLAENLLALTNKTVPNHNKLIFNCLFWLTWYARCELRGNILGNEQAI